VSEEKIDAFLHSLSLPMTERFNIFDSFSPPVCVATFSGEWMASELGNEGLFILQTLLDIFFSHHYHHQHKNISLQQAFDSINKSMRLGLIEIKTL
jgi:hypothetical protein